MLELKKVAHEPAGQIRNNYRTWLRHCLQARGKIRRFTYDRFFLGSTLANQIAHHDHTGGDAHTAGKLVAVDAEFCDCTADCKSGSHGALGLVFMCSGPAKVG